jgi:hypothetical protein
MRFISTGETSIRSVKCCVLFDPADGAIHHVHHVVTIDGADEISDSALEKRTRGLAQELGIEVGRLELLHVDAANLKPGTRYGVETGKKRMVALGPRAATQRPDPDRKSST